MYCFAFFSVFKELVILRNRIYIKIDIGQKSSLVTSVSASGTVRRSRYYRLGRTVRILEPDLSSVSVLWITENKPWLPPPPPPPHLSQFPNTLHPTALI